jgi:hypothetical protein
VICTSPPADAQQMVSHHTRILVAAGLITRESMSVGCGTRSAQAARRASWPSSPEGDVEDGPESNDRLAELGRRRRRFVMYRR